jgi:hypothetical protein
MHDGSGASGCLVSGPGGGQVPKPCKGRAVGAGLDGECAHRAIIDRAAMRAVGLAFLVQFAVGSLWAVSCWERLDRRLLCARR